MLDYDRLLWAKSEPFCTLSQHMIAVGACAEVYLSSSCASAILRNLSEWMNLSEVDTIKCIGYAFALHDIGKAHPSFQYRSVGVYEALKKAGVKDLQRNGEAKFRHEQYGANLLRQLWKQETDIPCKVLELLAAVIRLHHQGKAEYKSINLQDSSHWPEIHRDLELRMRRLFSPDFSASSLMNVDALGMLLTALLVLCDWVASSSDFGVFAGGTDEDCYAWSKQRAGIVFRRFGLIVNKEIAFPISTDFCAFWPEIPREGLRPLQRACETLLDGQAALTIIEAPPGEGKTEAALYLAGQICRQRKLHGIYMALPTAATSNQMVERVRKLFAQHDIDGVRLLHGSAWMVDDISALPEQLSLDEDASQAADWLRPLRRGMLSENAVGTVDQAMASVLRIKYGMLRLAGLSEKVLIIDEIHAYDTYMSRIISRLLQWCKALRIPVILLSATLQQSQKDKYIRCFSDQTRQTGSMEYPLITQVNDSGETVYTKVDDAFVHMQFRFKAVQGLGDIELIVDLAQRMTIDGGCVCIMLNTVRRAQEVYLELKRRGDPDIMLFHARFRMARRASIEKECLDVFGKGKVRPHRKILVCTQVVEMSLDLDFDGMITELAPVDLLIQRAGRVHRHEGNPRPETMRDRKVVVLTPGVEAPVDLEKRYMPFSGIYAPCVLHATEQWLGKEQNVRMPEDVRACIERVYQSFDEKEVEAYIKKMTADVCAEAEADACLYDSPDEEYFFGRIPSKTQLINMEDSDDLSTLVQRSGARTRNGAESVCIAFLPKNYICPEGDELSQAKHIMEYACSLRLTGMDVYSIIKDMEIRSKRVRPNKYLNYCIPLSPDEQGAYMIGDLKFYADDEIGIWRGEPMR